MKVDLRDRVAIITGAGRGIGREISITLADAGATLVLAARSREELESVAEEIIQAGGQAMVKVTDITDPESVQALFRDIHRSWPRLDILVNNAGHSYVANLLMSKDEPWRRVLETNLHGANHCTRLATRAMIRAKSGRIINIASVAGQVGAAYNSAYAASKAAMIAVTKSLALEVAGLGITVNAICPWHLDTRANTEAMAVRAKMFGKSAAAYRDEIATQSPLGRLIRTEEIAGLALFLASDAAAGITGQAINVSGGAVQT